MLRKLTVILAATAVMSLPMSASFAHYVRCVGAKNCKHKVCKMSAKRCAKNGGHVVVKSKKVQTTTTVSH